VGSGRRGKLCPHPGPPLCGPAAKLHGLVTDKASPALDQIHFGRRRPAVCFDKGELRFRIRLAVYRNNGKACQDGWLLDCETLLS
jgi:hypothetical protein